MTRYYWQDGESGRLGILLTLEQARGAAHAGQCDADVLALSREPVIASQLATLPAGWVRAYLHTFGAWDDEELSDDAMNLQRLLWAAAGDVSERPEDYAEEVTP